MKDYSNIVYQHGQRLWPEFHQLVDVIWRKKAISHTKSYIKEKRKNPKTAKLNEKRNSKTV